MQNNLQKFLADQSSYVTSLLKLNKNFSYEQAIARVHKSMTHAHVTYSLSDIGLHKPTKLQIEFLGSYENYKITVRLVYLDTMFLSLSGDEIIELGNFLKEMELELNRVYQKKISNI